MWCPSCGSKMKDDAKFCGVCGAKIASDPAQETGSGSIEGGPGQRASADSVQPQQTTAASGLANPPVQQVQAPAAAAPAQSAGCLGAAWHDITSSPNWVKRILLLMVMKCVPVLGMYVDGYALGWAADAAKGNVGHFPVRAFDRHTILRGLFYTVLNILFLIASTWTFVLNLIPVVGFIAVLAVSLFANAFFALAAVRMALHDRFGAAFDLSKLFVSYKKRVGGLIGATFVPSLIIGIIFTVIFVIIIAIATVSTLSAISSMSSMMGSMYGSRGYSADPYAAMGALQSLSEFATNPFGAITGVISALGTLIVVLAMLYMFLSAFAEIWSLRAVGRWIAQNAPEWVHEEE